MQLLSLNLLAGVPIARQTSPWWGEDAPSLLAGGLHLQLEHYCVGVAPVNVPGLSGRTLFGGRIASVVIESSESFIV